MIMIWVYNLEEQYCKWSEKVKVLIYKRPANFCLYQKRERERYNNLEMIVVIYYSQNRWNKEGVLITFIIIILQLSEAFSQNVHHNVFAM